MTTSIENELEALVDAERSRPDAGSADADRVWKGVQARLDGAPPPASVPSGGMSLGIVAASVVGVVLVVGLAWWAWPRSPDPFVEVLPRPLPMVAIEAMASPHLHARLDAGAMTGEGSTRSVPTKTSGPKAGSSTSAKAGPSTSAKAGSRAKATASSESSVTDELALIERARTALAKGRATSALKALGEHRRRFPKGAFVEEAAALRASALCKAGRAADARAAAVRFRARWPGSVHTARVAGCDDAPQE